jgi:endonuclease-3
VGTREGKRPVWDLRRRRSNARKILEILRREFPQSACSLDHRDAWQLLVATILSAQCTDAMVNKVTPTFFAEFPGPRDVAEASLDLISEIIRPTGFYKNKAKSLKGAAQAIIERHKGKVPGTMEELVKLPGVGRKTANVVLGEIWQKPEGVVVDTHVSRVAFKLGLTDQTDPVKIEQQLGECIPPEHFRDFGHLIIDHGRQTCKARAPQCDACPLYSLCEVRG